MLFYSRRVKQAARRLGDSYGRQIDGEAILDVVSRHQRPAKFAENLLRVLDSEEKRAWLKPSHYRDEVRHLLAFGPSELDLLTEAIGIAFPPQTGKFGKADPAFVEAAVEGLSGPGYVKFENYVSEADVKAIEAALSAENMTFVERSTKRVHKGYTPENVADSTSNVVEISNQDLICGVDAIRKLALNPSILEAVQAYFGAPPIHVQANAWWSTPYSASGAAKSEAAQMFHQDREFIRFVKCFVYLNDVTPENGPHEYITGSLHDYPSVTPPKYNPSNRLEDAYLRERYAADRFVTMTGTRGTLILEDTGGFHKGVPLLAGHRMLLQFEYAVSLYNSPVARFDAGALDAGDKVVGDQVPRVFQNYG